ncbi:FliA/WhiG family RNA polymerase sigma factor [Curvibacter sp. APW13]|uniref:FliA/WhiG family RNA polymerase sigma factor n=1 Tax=Curvibacter sp. APW13 TaxID=3077236 RepID=UPI0028DD7308|nr:FliA/WhiG family RNA polymerase sigma factor [Curvibacter sp. APW13]MDT8991915.1 FliA/WhiG family RNA polymerase sigma factor [Curvibacter sp. APW13]
MPKNASRTRLKRLVEDQAPRVRATAASLVRRLPASVEREDLEQDGFVGLMEAMVRWTRATNGEHFENYVAQRARGAMLDGLRAMDPASRTLRAHMRLVEQAIQRLGHRLGRLPREGEVATELEMPLADYQRLLQQAQGYKLLVLEDLEHEADSPDYLGECARRNEDPLVVLERSAFRQGLAQALAALEPQAQKVLHLYYGMGLRMHEVGTELGLSESRVSQLHTHAIAELRAALQSPDARFSMLKPRSKPR